MMTCSLPASGLPSGDFCSAEDFIQRCLTAAVIACPQDLLSCKYEPAERSRPELSLQCKKKICCVPVSINCCLSSRPAWKGREIWSKSEQSCTGMLLTRAAACADARELTFSQFLWSCRTAQQHGLCCTDRVVYPVTPSCSSPRSSCLRAW